MLKIAIRKIALSDAEAAAQLSGEFGYPLSTEVMETRIRNLATLQNHAVFVACVDGAVVGWIDVGITHHLQAEPYGEIGGLVVSTAHRSAGIGRRLVIEAERFARECGVAQMLVRSRIEREAAHQFYLRDGYQRTKTSAVFTKALV